MRFWFTTVAFGVVAAALPAADLTQAKFTQVINKVSVVSAANRTTTAAKLNDQFAMPDLVETGPDSLAELVAADKTITRVGANTIFSFDSKGRNVKLEQGSLLFHSPKGKGGGTIKTKAASASVLGTTIVVTATVGGGFKAIVLEGKGQITLPNGSFRILQAGQVTFVLPGAQRFGPQLNINLSKLVENSRLVQGFEQELPSKPVIQRAIERQQILIRAGLAEDTRILVGNQATEDTVAVVDSTIIEQAVETRQDALALAKAADVAIRTADLLPFGSTSPKHLFLDRTPLDVPVLGVLNFSGLVARNITITAASLDFTPFVNNQTDFTLVADNTLEIKPPAVVVASLVPDLDLTATLTVGVTPLLQAVSFVARNALTIEPGYFIRAAHLGDISFISGATMSLDNVSFENLDGKLELNGKGGLAVNDGGINGQSLLVNGSTVDIQGGNYSAQNSAVFSGYGTTLNTDGTTISGDIVSLQANTSSDLHATTASASTQLNLNSQQDVKVAGGSYSVSGGGGNATVSAGRDIFMGSGSQFQANTIQMNAANNATLNGVQARGFTTLNIDATRNMTIGDSTLTGASSLPAVVANLTAVEILTANNTTFASIATISLSGRTVNLTDLIFPAGSAVTVNANDALNLISPVDLNTSVGAYTVSSASGTLQASAGRDIFMGSSAQFQANTIQMNAGNNATLNGLQARGFTTLNVTAVNNLAVASGSFTGASAASSAVNLTASGNGILDLNGTSISTVRNISLSAHTMNLSNVNFPLGSMVYLYSVLGTFNGGAGSVNFLSNVLYNGQDATGFVNLINPTSPTIFIARR